jgi:hypothetical protein
MGAGPLRIRRAGSGVVTVIHRNDLDDDTNPGGDVLQCRHLLADGTTWSGDTCPRDGGLDQNIYGDNLP